MKLTNPLTLQVTYEDGQSFGENAMRNGKPRNGTCIAATDCYCALIGKNLYLKILKKL